MTEPAAASVLVTGPAVVTGPVVETGPLVAVAPVKGPAAAPVPVRGLTVVLRDHHERHPWKQDESTAEKVAEFRKEINF